MENHALISVTVKTMHNVNQLMENAFVYLALLAINANLHVQMVPMVKTVHKDVNVRMVLNAVPKLANVSVSQAGRD
jgi:hypothetical protein